MKCTLRKLRLDRSGYEYRTGTYYGSGLPVYHVTPDANPSDDFTLRASTRQKAKELIRNRWPNATFYN